MNRLVIDEILTTKMLWERFLTQFIGREGILFRLFKAWFEKIPSRVPFLVPILFLAFLIGMSGNRAKRFLTRCPMCGSPTYRFYLGASDQEFICFNCYRIFIQKEKLHPKIMEKEISPGKSISKTESFHRKISLFLLRWIWLPVEGTLFQRAPSSLSIFIFILSLSIGMG